jgi:signal transduction histidine kinase
MIGNEFIGTVEVFHDVTKEKEVDRAKTEFVSLASHQLRTPLSAINWFAEMLLDGDAGKITNDQRHYIRQIRESNQRMVELINSLLNVSRIELGTFAVEPEPTDILRLAKSVISEEEAQIRAHNLRIIEKYDKLPKLSVDPKLFRIILQNLISNAIKYTPGRGTVTVSITRQQGGREKEENVLIMVRDTGYGIPKNQQGKIFTKLFRADNVLLKETEGTGLGLYIVKSIVEQSGGAIWFESEEDKGTTFYVTLPFKGMKAKAGGKKLS